MMDASAAAQSDVPNGRVVAIRGNIVDVRFEPPLPPRYRALRTGDEGAVVLEVEIHVTSKIVRCIALTATRGLWRGAPVLDSGGMIEIPVGKALLGRMLNVFGEPIDKQAAPETTERLPIHRPSLPLSRRVTSREIFTTCWRGRRMTSGDRGHIMWDELFVFPFLNLRIAELTRVLLLYRYRRAKRVRVGYRSPARPDRIDALGY